MSDANKQVQSVLDRFAQEGAEAGIQVAAYLDGSLAIDTWAGMADPSTGKPVNEDTLFVVACCTKGVVATCIHILADQGEINYNMPICRYWPEFAARGKSQITTARFYLCYSSEGQEGFGFKGLITNHYSP